MRESPYPGPDRIDRLEHRMDVLDERQRFGEQALVAVQIEAKSAADDIRGLRDDLKVLGGSLERKVARFTVAAWGALGVLVAILGLLVERV